MIEKVFEIGMNFLPTEHQFRQTKLDNDVTIWPKINLVERSMTMSSEQISDVIVQDRNTARKNRENTKQDGSLFVLSFC